MLTITPTNHWQWASYNPGRIRLLLDNNVWRHRALWRWTESVIPCIGFCSERWRGAVAYNEQGIYSSIVCSRLNCELWTRRSLVATSPFSSGTTTPNANYTLIWIALRCLNVLKTLTDPVNYSNWFHSSYHKWV